MTGPVVVYRTADPAVLDAYAERVAALVIYEARLDTALTRLGVAGYQRTVTSGHAPGRFLGLTAATGQPVPAGWWRSCTDRLITPDTATQAGRDARRAVDSLRYPHVPLPGMPYSITWERWHTAARTRLHAGYLYAAWDNPMPGGRVDGTLWTRVPRTLWDAATQQHEKKEGPWEAGTAPRSVAAETTGARSTSGRST